YVGIAGLADRRNPSVLNGDVRFHDSPIIEDQRIRDDRVDRTFATGPLRLAHSVADDLAAAELHLLAIGGKILLHLYAEIRIGEAHFVADGRAEHLRVGCAAHPMGHGRSLRGRSVKTTSAAAGP